MRHLRGYGWLVLAALLMGGCVRSSSRAAPGMAALPPTITPLAIQYATATRMTGSTAAATVKVTATATISPTKPPAGEFAIQFYPPLVLEYDSRQWVDASEYDNPDQMVNLLQHTAYQTCTIVPLGPSGFYPENMKKRDLGAIHYQVLLDQRTEKGDAVHYYFAESASGRSIANDVGVAHFAVIAGLADDAACRKAAEAVLASLRRGE